MSEIIVQLNEKLIHTELKVPVKNSLEETMNDLLNTKVD